MQSNNKMSSTDLNKTNQILMELPLFRNLMDEKQELEEHVRMLKHNIMYFESTNRKLLKKVEKLKKEIKTMKKNKKTKVEEDDNVVFIKEDKIDVTVVQPAIKMVIEEDDDHPALITCTTIQFPTQVEVDEEIDDELSVGQELGERESKEEVEVVEEEVEVVEEEVEVVEEEVDDEEEEVDDEEEEVEEEEVEVVEEEVEVEVVEEEVEVEVVEEEVEVVEEEVEEVEVEGEEEEDVYEIEIKGKTYYVSNEKNSVIYAADENGEITIEAGKYVNGKPVFI